MEFGQTGSYGDIRPINMNEFDEQTINDSDFIPKDRIFLKRNAQEFLTVKYANLIEMDKTFSQFAESSHQIGQSSSQ
jgi:hypothetical protein